MGNFDKYGAFSGYLDIAETSKKLHYLFFEAQENSVDAPVMIWFNGGPGCSSMLGFMQENGPFKIESGGTKFHESEFAWNKETNLLYIEMPAGIGYSYCEGVKDCAFDDEITGKDNLTVVLEWFEKFPEFKTNDLYISGESYAGVYAPYLAYYINEHNETYADDDTVFKPALKGFAVGNGVTNWKYDTTAAYIDMAYWHSLMDETLHEKFVALDCDWKMPNMIGVSDECIDLYMEFDALTTDVNVYDIFGTCWGLGPYPQSSAEPHLYNKTSDRVHQKVVTPADYTPWTKGPMRSNPKVLKELPPCTFGSELLDYMNSAEVRTAMHIPEYVQAWDLCKSGLNYISQPKASQWIYEALAGKIKMLHYSGDTDGAVPTAGTQAWIATLGWNTTSEWKQYTVEGQVAGYWEAYEGNLTFGTVHGAGHMAPQFKPPQTYHLVFNWLFDREI
jgi:carboxypeptidase C (cathepsin A)